MKRIIVPTDLSKNSRSGLRFAIQLASQDKVQLIFFYAIELLLPTRWNDVKAKIYMDDEIEAETEKLRKFVMNVYSEMKRTPENFRCIVRYGAPVSTAVLDYASAIKASYICIGTRGAGKIQRIIGTHASAVIRKSPIPVFVVPKNYKATSIDAVLYASDLSSLKTELKKVSAVAKRLGSGISVVHYVKPGRQQIEDATIRENRSVPAGIDFYQQAFNTGKSMVWHLNQSAKKYRADVIAMFRDRDRPLVERIIRGSNSAQASFDCTKPVLIYPRQA